MFEWFSVLLMKWLTRKEKKHNRTVRVEPVVFEPQLKPTPQPLSNALKEEAQQIRDTLLFESPLNKSRPIPTKPTLRVVRPSTSSSRPHGKANDDSMLTHALLMQQVLADDTAPSDRHHRTHTPQDNHRHEDRPSYHSTPTHHSSPGSSRDDDNGSNDYSSGPSDSGSSD